MRTITSAPKLLTLLLLLMVSFSAYGFEAGGLKFRILSETDRTVSVSGSDETTLSGDIKIPPKVTYASKTYDVIEIEFGAFTYCTSITSMTIPNSVTTISTSSFSDCVSLESINVDSGNSYYSSIEGVLYNKDASTILKFPRAKKATSTSFSLPTSVTTIGAYAFYYCTSLYSVTIPNSVTTIESDAFNACTSLVSVTIPNSVTTIDEDTFYYCTSLRSVTIPNSVTTIGAGAFSRCSSLKSVAIPNSVMTIGGKAFYDCGFRSVTIPNSVTTIGAGAFSRCSSLKSVAIPNSVTTIGGNAFSYCRSLTSVTIPASVTSLGEKAFYDCDLLECIYMQVKEPLSCTQVVSDKCLELCTLYVPTGTLEAYKKVDPWRNFWNIEEMDYSGINDVGTDNEEALQFSVNDGVLTIIGIGEDQSLAIYDMHGREVYRGVSRTIENLARGIYIVKVGNKAVKVMI